MIKRDITLKTNIMKKLAVMVALLVSTIVMAQERPQRRGDMKPEHRREMMEQLTPEQMAELKTKHMTLALDLSEKQAKEVLQLNTEMATKRKAHFEEMKAKKDESDKRPKLSAEERFQMKESRLDAEIAEMRQMKTILTDTQYNTWKDMRAKRKEARFSKRRHHKQGAGKHFGYQRN